jgi:hypothetical protein
MLSPLCAQGMEAATPAPVQRGNSFAGALPGSKSDDMFAFANPLK